MSKKSFTVAKFADEVDAGYIKRALEHCYYGTGYEDKFSDKLIRVLLSDYKKKAKNLAWYLKDENGRVRNYISLQPSAEKVLEDASSNSQKIRDILNWLKSVGAEFTAEEFISNKCVINKQTIKITKAIANRDLSIPYTSSVFSASTGLANKGISIAIDFERYLKNNSDELDLKTLTKSIVRFTKFGVLCSSDDDLIIALIPPTYIKVTVKDTLAGLSPDDLSKVFGNIGAEQMKVSIDLADMITSSTGNCNSCLSVDNIHHAGTIMYFRSDFSLIAFTHDANDRLKKHGRSWLFLRLTEDGFPRRIPFWKQQKAYGSVSNSHSLLLRDDIKKKTHEVLGFSNSHFTARSFSIEKRHASPNVNAIMGSHTEAAGYIDTAGSDTYAWYMPKNQTNDFDKNSETPLVFPDFINVQGELTNAVNFRNNHGSSRYYGSLNPNIYEITCSVTGNIVLASDAMEIEGIWFSKEALEVLLTKTPQVASEITTPDGTFTVVEDSDEEEDLDEDVDVDGVDVDDF